MKKNYESPQMNVIEMKDSDIICTSGKGTFSASSSLELGNDEVWGTDPGW